MKKQKKITIILLIFALIISSINLNISNAYSDTAYEIVEKMKSLAKKAETEHGVEYVRGLSNYQASVEKSLQEKDYDYLKEAKFVNYDTPIELRQGVKELLQSAIDEASKTEVVVPSGITEEQKKEVEDAVNAFIANNKNRPDYKQLIQNQIDTKDPIGYTDEQMEYRKKLYQNELDRIEIEEELKAKIEAAKDMTAEELEKEIARLKRELARYQNMASGYQENGKSRDYLIKETQILITQYENILAEKKQGVSHSTGILGESNASGDHTVDDVINNANSFIQAGKNEENKNGSKIKSDNLQTASNTLYNILLSIGVVIAVAVGMYLGVKFMMSSAEDKAKVKESLIPYIAGCVVIFGAFIIWKLAILLLNGLS